MSFRGDIIFWNREAIDCFWQSGALGQKVCVRLRGSVANSF